MYICFTYVLQINREGVFGPMTWDGDEAQQQVTLEIKRAEFSGGSSTSEKMVKKSIKVRIDQLINFWN